MQDRDVKILRAILGRGDFGHYEHLELAWTYLGLYDVEMAHQVMSDAIRHVAELHGMPGRYHETMTRAWVHLVAVHRQDSDAHSFDAFIAENPGLLDKHLLDRHFSRNLIASDQARARWADPDLRQLPV
jgi:hypothetical protein